MIKIENLTKEFGEVRAIRGLTFEVFEGEILGFLGPNGAGKTTTMRILTCFFPPTSGRATVAGFDVVEDPHEVRRVIGYMPEGVPLYREMDVTSALDFVAHAKGYGKADRKRFVDEAIEETNLGDVRKRMIGHLSKGYRQRVGLAQAIIGDPKVLILDEPTVGLDPKQIAEVRNLIKNMAGRRTVILSTHILPEVQMTCTRAVIINRGQIAASGTPEKLTTQMRRGSEIELIIAGPTRAVEKALGAVAGVSRVERVVHHGDVQDEDHDTAKVCNYKVHSLNMAPELQPGLAETVVRHGWQLIEMRTVGLTLEDIFLQVISSDGIPAENGTAEAPAASTSTTGEASSNGS
ncbi:MAG: ABC transporter ATP-binding protein [Candidatus Sumerlaeaceae bacterium]|nr:ABC transporter ATP-binding protein [Candidatus Sumerlaeaceae bacterium]